MELLFHPTALLQNHVSYFELESRTCIYPDQGDLKLFCIPMIVLCNFCLVQVSFVATSISYNSCTRIPRFLLRVRKQNLHLSSRFQVLLPVTDCPMQFCPRVGVFCWSSCFSNSCIRIPRLLQLIRKCIKLPNIRRGTNPGDIPFKTSSNIYSYISIHLINKFSTVFCYLSVYFRNCTTIPMLRQKFQNTVELQAINFNKIFIFFLFIYQRNIFNENTESFKKLLKILL